MNTTRGLIIALFVLIVGTMSIAACGGDDDDAAKTSATATKQSSSAPTATAAGGAATTSAAVATTPAVNVTEPAGSGVTADDTCALITKSEVEEALGETITDPVSDAAFDTTMPNGDTASVGTCGYTSASYASSISVTFWSAQQEGVEAMIQLACEGHEMISGLGDTACWYDDRHVQIQAAKGGSFLDIFATMSGDASDVLQTLSEKALSRM